METDVTQILKAITSGRREATEELLPIVYKELRSLAASKLNKEVFGHTLEPTALVHEAYLRLIGDIDDDWQNRRHFFAAAAEAMRRILIDHARAKKSQKRGGEFNRVSIKALEGVPIRREEELLALDAALTELAERDKSKADLVKLRFFVGMNMEQAAEVLGMSLRTAERNWAYARAWLHRQICEGAANDS